MEEKLDNKLPFQNLGQKLRTTRLKQKQSLREVSGSIELDIKKLQNIEKGSEKPSEETLDLLIEHYGIKDPEASGLINLAGYGDEEAMPMNLLDLLAGLNIPKTFIMLSQTDQRALFTDSLDIHYDSKGLLMNFKQGLGNPQPVSVAKLAMTYEQAEQVFSTLQRVLLKAKYLRGPKSLPPESGNQENI